MTIDGAGKSTYALKGELLGIVAAAYSLGAILSVPFVPILAQRAGRQWSIMFGSVVVVVGSLLQGFSVNGGPIKSPRDITCAHLEDSRNVYHCKNVPWIRERLRNRLWLGYAGRAIISQRASDHDFSLQCILLCRIFGCFWNNCSHSHY